MITNKKSSYKNENMSRITEFTRENSYITYVILSEIKNTKCSQPSCLIQKSIGRQ